jgi:hypothetical protein
MLLISGVEAVPVDTTRLTPFEAVPLDPFFTVTVNVPAARVAWPPICELTPVALTLQGEPQPGPLKYTDAFEPSKFAPVTVKSKGCPPPAGLGVVVRLKI